MKFLGRVLAAGALVVSVFALFALIVRPFLFLLILPGMPVAGLVVALAGQWLQGWSTGEGLDGPLLFAVLSTISAFLMWWWAAILIWTLAVRYRRVSPAKR